MKNLYFAFIDFQKAFDQVPRDVYCGFWEQIAEEWLDKTVQSMYRNAQSHE